MKKRTIYNKAFTLIELMVVMAIISLLSALVLNSLAGARMKANDTKIAQDLRQFRIAAELYYNDNHTYPTGYVGINNQNKNIVINKPWSNKLSFFIKTAEAALPVHITALCQNFDTMAGEMVSKKYLSSIPVHPYDDDATGNGICYKAVKTDRTFASYGVLTTNINVNGEVTSKRTGFIIGDTSPEEISKLSLAISETDTAVVGVMEPVYPLAEKNGDLENINPDLLASVVNIAAIEFTH